MFKKLLAVVLLASTVSFMPGCAMLGLEQAQTTEQQVAYGYATLASVRNTAADLLIAKIIKVEDAKMVQSMADTARASLDIGRDAAAQGKPKDAQAALSLATRVLSQIQTYLATRKGGS